MSVSPCPEAWRSIARLGQAPTWRLANRTGQDMAFVDMHAATRNPDIMDDVTSWAVANDLAEYADQWLTVFYDSEIEACRFSAEKSRERAKAEAEFFADDEVFECENLEAAEAKIRAGHATAAITCQVMLRLTPLGQERVRGGGSTGIDGRDMATVLWAECVAKEIDPSIVGCWWDDTFDPASLSAPRGVIFTNSLTDVSPILIPDFPRHVGIVVAPTFTDVPLFQAESGHIPPVPCGG